MLPLASLACATAASDHIEQCTGVSSNRADNYCLRAKLDDQLDVVVVWLVHNVRAVIPAGVVGLQEALRTCVGLVLLAVLV